MSTPIQIPRNFPVGEGKADTNDTVWFIIKVYKMDSQSASPRSNHYIKRNYINKSYKILAPADFQENITHKWEDYENIATRLGDLYRKAGKSTDQFMGVAKALGQNGTSGITNILSNTSLESEARRKIDAPLIYNDSDRREYTLMFQFADQGDTWRDVMQVITELKEYSSPSIINENDDASAVNINFPYIFSVRTEPVPFININHAVITALQPQYYSPFRNGYPTKCDLSITFRDMEPTYRQSWNSKGLITTDKS